MKKLLITLTLIASASAFANCMNLSGTYKASAENCHDDNENNYPYAKIWGLAHVNVGSVFTIEQHGCEQLEITSETNDLNWHGSYLEGGPDRIILNEEIGSKGLYAEGTQDLIPYPFNEFSPEIKTTEKLKLDRNGNLVAEFKRGRILSSGLKCTFERL